MDSPMETTGFDEEDYKQKTLDWAAAAPEGKPSERLDFLKRFIGLCTQDELRRLKKMVQIKRRRNRKDLLPPITKLEPDEISEGSGAVTSSFDAACPSDSEVSSPKSPWWEEYGVSDIVAIDTEQVTKPKFSPQGIYSQIAASVDIVDHNNSILYSTLVHHQPGSFKDHDIWRALTGFSSNSFANSMLPSEDTVKEMVAEILKTKLVITVGGESDFNALGLQMADFDYFDLQSHFFVEKVNEHGVLVREGHSLRSLSSHFLKRNQSSTHSSLEDAQATMDLFKIYKEIKMKDDPNNCDSRFNYSKPYNDIPVIPNPLKKKKR